MKEETMEYCDLCPEMATKVARDYREKTVDGVQTWDPTRARYGCDAHPPLPPRHMHLDGTVSNVETVATLREELAQKRAEPQS